MKGLEKNNMDLFFIILGVIVFGLALYLMRKFFETYYDELFRVFLVIAISFVIIQIIFLSLIYFELIDYTYSIFEKILYINLIWAVPFALLLILVRERCAVCKSFETSIYEKELMSKYIGRHYTGSGDLETSESIYEYLYEVHFMCNNCSHEYYGYELREDNSSKVKHLSEEEAKKYLKENGASDAFILSLVGLYFFL